MPVFRSETYPETQTSMLSRFARAVRRGDWPTAASLSDKLIPVGDADRSNSLDHWSDESLAFECGIHARLAPDPNVAELMRAVSKRLAAHVVPEAEVVGTDPDPIPRCDPTPATREVARKGGRSWPLERDLLFVEMWNKGETFEELAATFGVNVSTVSGVAYRLRRFGHDLVRRGGRPPWDEERLARLRRMLADGASKTELAQAFGLRPSSVGATLSMLRRCKGGIR